VLSSRLGLQPSIAGRLVHRGVEVDYVIVDEENEAVLAAEAKWSSLGRRGAEETVRETMAKPLCCAASPLPRLRVQVALYLRSVEGPGPQGAVVVEPDDLPWRSGCPSRG